MPTDVCSDLVDRVSSRRLNLNLDLEELSSNMFLNKSQAETSERRFPTETNVLSQFPREDSDRSLLEHCNRRATSPGRCFIHESWTSEFIRVLADSLVLDQFKSGRETGNTRLDQLPSH